ncbi:manganese efflux pump MntP family protein [bacterium]|nr:manganese efflux pump MntP family protein [bacterium]
MIYLEITLLALALAADSFTVGSVVGLTNNSPRQIFRLSFHFGLFQALMPLIGYYFGSFFLQLIKDWDHWIIFAILSLLGIKMIVGALGKDNQINKILDFTKGKSLIGLSLAVSVDALAAGVSLAFSNASIFLSILIIGVVSSLATLIAMLLANIVADKIGNRGEIIAGIVLIGLGIKILIEHTL